jgi:hypothetical protein
MGADQLRVADRLAVGLPEPAQPRMELERTGWLHWPRVAPAHTDCLAVVSWRPAGAQAVMRPGADCTVAPPEPEHIGLGVVLPRVVRCREKLSAGQSGADRDFLVAAVEAHTCWPPSMRAWQFDNRLVVGQSAGMPCF